MGAISSEDRALLLSGLPALQQHGLKPGMQVNLRDDGPRDADTIVFLHGLGGHSGGWRGPMAALKSSYRVIAWDAPGFGGSTPLPQDSPSAADYAERLIELLAVLSLDRVHLVGSSWGAVIAAALAAFHPERISTLTLLVPNLCLGALPEPMRSETLTQLLSSEAVLTAAPEAFAAMLTAPDSDELVLGQTRLLKDQTTARGYEQAVLMMGNTDTLSFVRRIVAPTLVLGGTEDQLAPVAQHVEPIASAIEHSRLEIIAGCGHLLKIEAPARVAELIASHVSDAGRRASE